MKNPSPLNVFLTATVVTLVMAVPRVLLACAVCYGSPEASQTKGMNLGIVTMLGVTGVVLGGLGGMIICFARRARRHDADMSP